MQKKQTLGLVLADMKNKDGALLVNTRVEVVDEVTGSPVRVYATRSMASPTTLGEVLSNSAGRVQFYAVKGRSLLLRVIAPNGELIAETADIRPDSWFDFADSLTGEQGPPGPDEATGLKATLEASADASALLQGMLDAFAAEYTSQGWRNREIDLRGAKVKLLRPLILNAATYSEIKIRNGSFYPDTTQNWATVNGFPQKSLIELRGQVSDFRLEEVDLDCKYVCNGVLNDSDVSVGDHQVVSCSIHSFLSWGIDDPGGGLIVDTATTIEQHLPGSPDYEVQNKRTANALVMSGIDSKVDMCTFRTARWPLKMGFDWDMYGDFTLGSAIINNVRGSVIATTTSGSDILTAVSTTEPLRVGMVIESPKLQSNTKVLKVLTTTTFQVDKTAVANGEGQFFFDGANLLYKGTVVEAPNMVSANTKILEVSGTRTVLMDQVAISAGINEPVTMRKGPKRPRVFGTSMLNTGQSSTPVSSMGSFYVGRETDGALITGCRTSRAMAEIWSTAISIEDHDFEESASETSTPNALFRMKSTKVAQTLDGFLFKPGAAFNPSAGSPIFSMETGVPGTGWDVVSTAGLATIISKIEKTAITVAQDATIHNFKSLQTKGRLRLQAAGTTTPVDLEVEANRLNIAAFAVNFKNAVLAAHRKVVEEIEVNMIFGESQSGNIVLATNATAKTWQLPGTLPVGWNVKIMKKGAGIVTVAPSNGAILNDSPTNGINVTSVLSISCIENEDGFSAVLTTAL